MQTSPTFHLSLRALQHPLTLICLGMLLLNDHWLKAAAPSWFTGKLSDFAGLFFFPFVLLALLAWPSTALRVRPLHTLTFAVGFTGVWFTLFKTVPVVNTLTAQLIGLWMGGPVRIVLDPSDLLALPMLALTWQLGHHLNRAAASAAPRKRAYLVLGLATLASLATSPCPVPPKIIGLTTEGSLSYAVQTNRGYGSEKPYEFLQSADGGASWQYVQPNATLSATLPSPATLPKTVCLSTNAQRCYRITGDETVQASDDGGAHWYTTWELPMGRRRFMERYVASTCKLTLDMGPYDIALAETANQHTVLVALGKEGLLRRTPQGEWEQQTLGGATPTPYALEVLTEPGLLLFSPWYALPEFFMGIFGAWLSLIMLSMLAWRTLLKASPAPKPWVWWPLFGLLIGLACLLFGRQMVITTTGTFTVGPLDWFTDNDLRQQTSLLLVVLVNGWPISLSFLGCFMLAWGLSWWQVKRHAPTAPVGPLFFTILCTAGEVAFTPLFYSLWLIGLIPLYEIAFALVWLIAGLLIGYSTQHIRSARAA